MAWLILILVLFGLVIGFRNTAAGFLVLCALGIVGVFGAIVYDSNVTKPAEKVALCKKYTDEYPRATASNSTVAMSVICNQLNDMDRA